MGVLAFQLPEAIPPEVIAGLTASYLAGGYDQAPTPGEVRVADGVLTFLPVEFESGFATVPWPVGRFGAMLTSTATLRSREEPYRLLIELARGKLNQVRNQLTEWVDIGLQPWPGFVDRLAAVTKRFGPSAVGGDNPAADETAAEVLAEAYEMADQLARMYTAQLFATRHQEGDRLNTGLGCRLAKVPETQRADEFLAAFNSVTLVPIWKSVEPVQSEFEWEAFDVLVEWASEAKLAVTVGPILDLHPYSLPGWVGDWTGDLPSLAAFFCDYVESIISRYRGKIARWHVLTGFNHADILGLTEDERLRLSSRVIDAARQADPEGEVVVGLTDPWGGYKIDPSQTYSPLVFADTLLRTGVRIGALELDLRPAGGELRRDLLDVARLIEGFSVLGVPLRVNTAFPVDMAAPVIHEGKPPTGTSDSLESTNRTSVGRLHGLIALAVSLPTVAEVTWDQWDHDAPWGSPGSGLDLRKKSPEIDATDVFTGIRQAYLK